MTEKLKSSLQRLEQELHRTSAADPETQEHLNQLKGAVQQTLTQPDDQAHATLRERLKGAVQQFERRHPGLIAAAEEVSEALAHVGI
jgi:CHASE3 domain sensor protein